ncbi:MAG: 3-deoxy-7-phosphoheptulonate synthase [Erysipelotrichaceae bacterium]|nr:3-deoxy-7-phosphoheptulonate synthase [Erysipelotrichaceae bacterium]
MSFTFKQRLPIPKEIKEQFPMPRACIPIKQKRDQELTEIITGQSDRFLLIIGPCSADNEETVLDYVHRLKEVQETVKEKIMIVPRIYTNKPRTTGKGYKGMLHQPDPQDKPDMMAGLIAIRQMHIHVIEQTGLTGADEMLYPENHWYLNDVLSYNAVGARSVENQGHRLVASGVDGPCGMKNPTSGDFNVMLNSIEAAQAPADFIYRGWEVETPGNPYAHAILRGAVNKHGRSIPNYHYEDLALLAEMYAHRELKNPACIVDCNHSNSNKQYKQQIRIAKEVLHSCRHSETIRSLVKGLMIESYIEEGCQKITDGVYGKSITDPCLGWSDTKTLILELAELL